MSRALNTVISKICSFIPDKQYLELRYLLKFKKRLNLQNPKTYNEKLQWMKLYDRNPIYTKLVDKQAVKKLVKDVPGLNVIPTLAVWNNPDDIDLSNMPEQFVLKCTHDSGSVLIFKKKDAYSLDYVKEHFRKAIKRDQYLAGREWAYKNVRPRIIAEPFMIDSSGSGLRDYKFFCFDGVAKALFIATDRGKEGTDVKFDFFDMNFKHLPFRHGHPNAEILPDKPENFDEMKRIAAQLSKGLRHVRVDLYNINGDIYFGEMTFYHHCGLVPFTPEKWDYTFGSWIKI